MSYADIAKRAYDHHWRMDPIVRSLLDTDFYKLLMLQVIWKEHRNVAVTFETRNRTTSVRLAEEVDGRDLAEQLDHARTVRFAKGELVWLRGNTFFGRERLFDPLFIEWLEDFRLPEYELRREGGQLVLRFAGPWAEVSMWEIPALSILNELRSRAALGGMGRFAIDVTYARAKSKLWSKIERLGILAGEGPLRVGDFGTRRRHGHLWQRWCIEALREGVGASFAGTSNALFAKELGVEALGTNAHEMPMVYAAMAGGDDDQLRASRFHVMEAWERHYPQALRVMLPDTFGTTSFLADAPSWAAGWAGARPDSKAPIPAVKELIAWWEARGEDPREKLVVLSDGLDVGSIEGTARMFRDRVRLSYGWGTRLTNDFRECAPAFDRRLEPVSLVCKVVEAAGRGAVKLSDNLAKATGPADEVERYRRIFGEAGMERDEPEV